MLKQLAVAAFEAMMAIIGMFFQELLLGDHAKSCALVWIGLFLTFRLSNRLKVQGAAKWTTHVCIKNLRVWYLILTHVTVSVYKIYVNILHEMVKECQTYVTYVGILKWVMPFAQQDGLTGSAWGDWSLYTDSPLRAFEEELGVQAPVGFWDPVGYTRDGDIEIFKRRRETEIKHGRVAMYVPRIKHDWTVLNIFKIEVCFRCFLTQVKSDKLFGAFNLLAIWVSSWCLLFFNNCSTWSCLARQPLDILCLNTSSGLATCLHPWAWSLQMFPTDWQQLAKCREMVGHKSLPSLATTSFPFTDTRESQESMGGKPSLQRIRKYASESLTPNLPMDDWLLDRIRTHMGFLFVRNPCWSCFAFLLVESSFSQVVFSRQWNMLLPELSQPLLIWACQICVFVSNLFLSANEICLFWETDTKLWLWGYDGYHWDVLPGMGNVVIFGMIPARPHIHRHNTFAQRVFHMFSLGCSSPQKVSDVFFFGWQNPQSEGLFSWNLKQPATSNLSFSELKARLFYEIEGLWPTHTTCALPSGELV